MPGDNSLEAGLSLLAAATEVGTRLRLIGGVAVAVHCPGADQMLRRTFGDLDFVAEPRQQAKVEEVFRKSGYAPDDVFNSLNGAQRLMFADTVRKVDVFVGDFSMCHRVPLVGRLGADPRTIPLAELLLTKLQVVEINRKDLQDAAAILAEHDLGSGDDELINSERMADLVGSDWGLYTTVHRNLDKLEQFAQHLPSGVRGRVLQTSAGARDVMEAAPKTRSWKLRARVGTRVRWYELPEEP